MPPALRTAKRSRGTSTILCVSLTMSPSTTRIGTPSCCSVDVLRLSKATPRRFTGMPSRA
ncbi:MAG: hypothetical protein WBF47_11030 [Xanthobacteraceae bacterium]